MSNKNRYIEIKSVCQGSSFVDEFKNGIEAIFSLLDSAEIGEDEGYLVSVVEMTEEEFKELPEFNGF